MSRQYTGLRESSRTLRTTIADALDVLEAETNFKPDDRAIVWLQPLQLQTEVVWLVSVVFECPTQDIGFVVPLRTAKAFFAIDQNTSQKRPFEMELLDGAIVGPEGIDLASGNRVRAVEIVPARLPYELSELDEAIIHLTISMIPGAEDRCYRDLRDDLTVEERKGIPCLRFIDFSKLSEGPNRPALDVPYLKVIRGRFEQLHPDSTTPSEQKIADALEKAGIRAPLRRPKAA
ncbi:hypothetical protein ACFIOY_15275 [Bradyrhizobium sp. TZ2]